MPQPHLATSPQEDLSVVLGRFHQWDAIQNAPSPAYQGGLKELSYEEAIAASRPRRLAIKQPISGEMPVVPAYSLAHDADQAAAITDNPEQQVPLSEVGPAVAAPIKKAVRRIAQPKVELAADSSAPAPARSLRSADKTKASHHPSADSIAKTAHPVNSTATQAPVKATARHRAKRSTHEAVRAAQPATFHGALVACLDGERAQSSRGRMAKAQTRSITKALAGAVTVPPSAAAPASFNKSHPKTARTISVNLRLSRREHSFIQAGAVEAGATMAAYIRDSTLQFRRTHESEKQIARQQKPSRRAADAPLSIETIASPSGDLRVVDSTTSNFLSRLKNYWFGRRLAVTA